MTIAPGTRIGTYEVIAPLGSGGMGSVYRARDTRLGREVALKLLPEATAASSEALERFTREARAVAALNHPNIITIYTTEEEHGLRFITMELVEGRTLDRIMRASGVPLGQFFDIAIPLTDALAAAHRKRITHRDLKPANVMVSNDGRVKVLDFGLARSADQGTGHGLDDATRLTLTQAGTILGTMPYMSPEQIEAKAVDHRSDIFSLGIVLYEMVVGERPFSGDSSVALMSSIIKDHPRSVSDLRSDVPGGLSYVIGRCLEKSPRDRFQSAGEIHAELKTLRQTWELGGTSATPRAAVRSSSSRGSSRALRVAGPMARAVPAARAGPQGSLGKAVHLPMPRHARRLRSAFLRCRRHRGRKRRGCGRYELEKCKSQKVIFTHLSASAWPAVSLSFFLRAR